MTRPSPRPRHAAPARAFTLAEVIVGMVITAFLAAATTLAISQATRARDTSAARAQAHERAEAAASRIARDCETAVRDGEVYFTRLLVTDAPGPAGDRDELLVYSRSARLVRPRAEQGEGGEYEVQYRLLSPPQPAPGGGMVLWRRCDPVPDEVYDGGGIAAAVVDGVSALAILASDGQAWYASWDSDRSGYPHAVGVTVTATDDRGRTTAVARKVVALDRTPLPVNPVETEDDESTGSSGGGNTGGGR
jgi:hypothetical protein